MDKDKVKVIKNIKVEIIFQETLKKEKNMVTEKWYSQMEIFMKDYGKKD